MGQIVQTPSIIRKILRNIISKESATSYFYELSKKSNYIRTDRIDKILHLCINLNMGT